MIAIKDVILHQIRAVIVSVKIGAMYAKILSKYSVCSYSVLLCPIPFILGDEPSYKNKPRTTLL
jgi:hypothetical protein